ncbi:T9SS type A sorting domain-containing protein [bacterium]|nr:T9SS type A sorting domain-containing protein [bacterium]
MKKLVFVLFFCFIMAGYLFAEEKTFVGDGVDNLWSEPNCWNPPGVPDLYDNVTIPEGNTCSFDLLPHAGLTTINNLTVNGTLNFDHDDKILHARGDVENNGTISSDFGEDIYILASGWFINNGDIFSDGVVNIFCLDLWNSTGGFIFGEGNLWGSGEAEHLVGINIEAQGEVINEGFIQRGHYDITGEGADIIIDAKLLNNSGYIQGGDGVYDEEDRGKGGSVVIKVKEDVDNTDLILGGLGYGTAPGGEVKIIAEKINVTGSIETGYSEGRMRKSPLLAGRNDLFLIADSIYIHSGDDQIIGGLVHIRGRKLVFGDITDPSTLIGETGIQVCTSAPGFADFSGVHVACAISSPAGVTNNIFCNTIIPPAEGLDSIFCPAPSTNPADESIVDGIIVTSSAPGAAGSSDSIRVLMQNLSTAAKILSYNISSLHGWVTLTMGPTGLINPFAFDSLNVSYNIPSGASNGDRDTVISILMIGTGFAETTMSEIMCKGEDVSIEEQIPSPVEFDISAYPNPFNGMVRIALEGAYHSTLLHTDIFDINGRKVCNFSPQSVGENAPTRSGQKGEFMWHPSSSLGSGIYLVRVTAGDKSIIRRVVYLK